MTSTPTLGTRRLRPSIHPSASRCQNARPPAPGSLMLTAVSVTGACFSHWDHVWLCCLPEAWQRNVDEQV